MAESPTSLTVKNEKKAAPVAASAAWAPFDSLRREIDRAFENFGVPAWRSPFPSSIFDLDLSGPRKGAWDIAPAVDVAEKEKEFEITAELPGIDEKDIEVKVADGSLTIKGEKKAEKEERKKDYYVSERSYGSFMRSFALPDNVNVDKIEAAFAKGVLTVKLPKTEAAPVNEKKIDVKSA